MESFNKEKEQARLMKIEKMKAELDLLNNKFLEKIGSLNDNQVLEEYFNMDKAVDMTSNGDNSEIDVSNSMVSNKLRRY